jgi:hypothetical protein
MIPRIFAIVLVSPAVNDQGEISNVSGSVYYPSAFGRVEDQQGEITLFFPCPISPLFRFVSRYIVPDMKAHAEGVFDGKILSCLSNDSPTRVVQNPSSSVYWSIAFPVRPDGCGWSNAKAKED